MKQKKYHPPTKFCVAPALGYWELNGKPVRYNPDVPGMVWRESEVTRELHLYLGWFE